MIKLCHKRYLEILDGNPFAIEHYFDAFTRGSNVVSPPGQERNGVVIQSLHAELGQIGLKGDPSEVFAAYRFDLGFSGL